MIRAWRITVQCRPRQRPNIDLLVRAVLALGEQMQAEADAQDGNAGDATAKREVST